MENLQYEIKFTNDKETVDMVLPNGESTKILVKDEAGQPRKFYLATDLYKALGSDKNKEPNEFLRSKHGKEQMIVRLEKAYKNAKIDIPGIYRDIKTDDRSGLPQEILDHFVVSSRGRFGGTWMERDIFLTYAMWISPELHALAVDCLGKYGHVELAPVNKHAELLLDIARDAEIQTLLEDKVDYSELDRKEKAAITAHASSRLEAKEKTKQLHQLIAIVWGAESPQDYSVSGIIGTTEGIINRAAIGATKETLSENLGISPNTYNRDVLTPSTQNCVAAATTSICQYLLDCIEDECVPGTKEFENEVGRLAKKARQDILFRGGRETRIIAKATKTKNTNYGRRGNYKVELKKNLEIDSLYTPLDKDKK